MKKKYNVGDLFVDVVSKDISILSYIFKIDNQLNLKYYHMRYLNANYKNSHWITEELDHWLENGIVYYPVIK